MGWSSAFVLVPTDNDLKRALQVVKAHNEHDGPDVGEVLVRLDVVEVPRKKVCRRDLGTGNTVTSLPILFFGAGPARSFRFSAPSGFDQVPAPGRPTTIYKEFICFDLISCSQIQSNPTPLLLFLLLILTYSITPLLFFLNLI
jgi:hypothetical protein